MLSLHLGCTSCIPGLFNGGSAWFSSRGVPFYCVFAPCHLFSGGNRLRATPIPPPKRFFTAYIYTHKTKPLRAYSQHPYVLARQVRWDREVKVARERVAAEAAEPVPAPKGNKKVSPLNAFGLYRIWCTSGSPAPNRATISLHVIALTYGIPPKLCLLGGLQR